MSVAGIQGGSLPSSLDVAPQNRSQQQPGPTSQTDGQTPIETSSPTLPAATQSSSSSAQPVQSERLSNFQTFVDDLQAGNLAGAEQALLALQQELQSAGLDPSSSGSASLAQSADRSKLENAFEAIETALSSGNLSQAQQAFAQFSQDAQGLSSTQELSSSETGDLSSSTFRATA